jgi:hypothetical protein
LDDLFVLCGQAGQRLTAEVGEFGDPARVKIFEAGWLGFR